MSGFAGIVNLGGAPVDRALLGRFEDFLHDRGPDGQGIWAEGNVGLVHTLFCTTDEARGERQPESLDGRVWITADARVDDRESLVRELASHGRDASTARPDVELILHAYALWGEACVEHLLGDFAFAIWDARQQKLFCARDHFGVRQFFYTQVGNAFTFSNSADVPRIHPGVPDDIYEQAIAEYLVAGVNSDLERTARAAIRRLAPAHVLVVADGQVRTRRYWTLPADPPTVFRRSQDYVERFLELFEQAVADRLRTDRVVVLLSGGMDSCSVAAMAKRLGRGRAAGTSSVSARTQTYRRLLADKEGSLALLAARHMGLPWQEFPLDERDLFGYGDQPEFRRPEPELTPLLGWSITDVLGEPSPAKVFLTGQGSDGIFSCLRLRHCRDRIQQGSWLQLAKEVSGHLLCEGRMRRLSILPGVRARLGGEVPARQLPDWLNPDLDRRLNLQEWHREYASRQRSAAPAGAVRPEAHGTMNQPVWSHLLAGHDPNGSGACLEARHPFFDLRLVRYVLSLPALPWCSDKELLRRAMRGLLPDEIRLASKRPLSDDFLFAHYRHGSRRWLHEFRPETELSRFVNVPRAVELVKRPSAWELAVNLRPFNLNYWLKWESRFAYKLSEEEFRVPTA
jgi:asparagine synthase (glutamine-hydrolysing)